MLVRFVEQRDPFIRDHAVLRDEDLFVSEQLDAPHVLLVEETVEGSANNIEIVRDQDTLSGRYLGDLLSHVLDSLVCER